MNHEALRKWIDTNGPLGLEKLAVKSGVSSSTIRNCLRGKPPVSIPVRRALCQAMRIAEDSLFPKVRQKTA